MRLEKLFHLRSEPGARLFSLPPPFTGVEVDAERAVNRFNFNGFLQLAG